MKAIVEYIVELVVNMMEQAEQWKIKVIGKVTKIEGAYEDLYLAKYHGFNDINQEKPSKEDKLQ